ncbi:7490_t:CDS:1, partial [Entrophospora sp. SA101]
MFKEQSTFLDSLEILNFDFSCIKIDYSVIHDHMGCSYPFFCWSISEPETKASYSENFIPIKFIFILYRGHSLDH